MKDKICGMFFIFISATLYIAHFIVSGIWASQLKGWNPHYGKMGTAMRELGYTPIVLALVALGLGIFYFIRAELKEHRSTKGTS